MMINDEKVLAAGVAASIGFENVQENDETTTLETKPTSPAALPLPKSAVSKPHLGDVMGVPPSSMPFYLASGAMIFVCCCLLILHCHRMRSKAIRKKEKQSLVSMFKYLDQFDVEDVDIKRNDSGGYNVTYSNSLANQQHSQPSENKNEPRLSAKRCSTGYNVAYSNDVSSRGQSVKATDGSVRPGISGHGKSKTDSYLFMSKRLVVSSWDGECRKSAAEVADKDDENDTSNTRFSSQL